MTNSLQKQTEDIAYMPRIRARFNAPDWFPPVRAYFHEAGLVQAFQTEAITPELNAINHLQDIFRYRKFETKDFKYCLAMVWGDNEDKMIDMIGVKDVPTTPDKLDWPGNPEMPIFIFRNGVYQPQEKNLCEDGMIVLGEDARYRRYCNNLQQYLENPPEIFGLKFE
jgi:hypothetical protein